MQMPDPAGWSRARLHNPRIAAGLMGTARRIQAELSSAGGVGVVLLTSIGVLVAGSNDFADAVGRGQVDLAEGPALVAATSGTAVRAVFDVEEWRWPAFRAAAVELGLGAVLSVPLRAGEETLGSVSACFRTPDGLATLDDVTLSDVAADVVGELQTARLLAQLGVQVSDLHRAFEDRSDIDIAVGVLMARHRCGADEARVRLGLLARREGVGLLDAARQVLRSPVDPA